MKILHALGWYFPESLGGTEVYVAALAARQRALRHNVEIAAPLPGLGAAEQREHAGLPVFRYPIPVNPTRAEAQSRVQVRGAEALHHHLDRLRPDILHVHTLTTGLGPRELRAARDLGIHIVATNHLGSVGYLCQRGTLMRWGERPCDGVVELVKCAACELQHRGLGKSAAWATAYAGRVFGKWSDGLPGRAGTAFGMSGLIAHNQELQRELLALVDRFVLLNRAAYDIVVKNGGDPARLSLNYLGVSHRGYRRKASPEKEPTVAPVTVGYLGRFVTIKGILDLARAVSALPKELPLRVELRGPPSDAEDIASQFEAILGRDSRVRFAPAVAPEEVPEILARYDVLCVPSIWFENGPTVVSEAHAVGTPVIGTRIGAMPELIRDGVDGALIEPGDWRGLATILREVAAHPEKTIDVWRLAIPPARTMEDIASDYDQLYEEVLSA